MLSRRKRDASVFSRSEDRLRKTSSTHSLSVHTQSHKDAHAHVCGLTAALGDLMPNAALPDARSDVLALGESSVGNTPRINAKIQ